MKLTYAAAAAVCTCCRNEANRDTVELVHAIMHLAQCKVDNHET